MDEEKLDKLKKETEVDNSRLEELIKQDITPEMEKEVFELLKQSKLFLPVDFGPDAFEGIEDTKPGDVVKGPKGFSIQFLTDPEGRKAVPLFTSEEMMKQAGAMTSVMVIYMKDLADMLKQTDKYSVISINPFTQFDLNMPMEAFLRQFDDEIDIGDIRNDDLKEFLHRKDVSEEEVNEFGEKLLKSVMITPCVDADGRTNFVLIWNKENKPHLPLFTDIDEFKKMFDNHREDIYPQAYHFIDLVKVAEEDLVINPASESLVLDSEMFKD